jgi:hypothetical protein
MDKPELGIHGYTVRVDPIRTTKRRRCAKQPQEKSGAQVKAMYKGNTDKLTKVEYLQGATRRQVRTVDYTGGASLSIEQSRRAEDILQREFWNRLGSSNRFHIPQNPSVGVYAGLLVHTLSDPRSDARP